jgi:hypothetical protein
MEAGYGSSSVYEDARSSRSSSSGATAVYDSVQRRRSMSNVNTSSSTVATANAAAAGGTGGVSNGRSTVSRAFSDVSSDVSSSNGSSSIGSNIAVVYSAADNTELQLQHLHLSSDDNSNSSGGAARDSRIVSGVRGEFRMRELSWREDESPSEATSSRVCAVSQLLYIYIHYASEVQKYCMHTVAQM